MNREDIIDNFSEFLRDNYYKELATVITKGEKALQVDFILLDKFNSKLADILLEKPEKTFQLFEDAVEQIDLPQKGKVKIRLFNIPESHRIRIRNIRAEHIGKLICVDGIVKRASEVRPEVAEITFQCPECGEKILVIQTEKDKMIRHPSICDNCKSRRGFKLLDQKLFDARWIAIEEPFEITTGERPSEIMVYLKEDLTSPRLQTRTDPGNRIRVIGILKEIPRRTMKGGKTRQLEILIDANNVEAVETEWEELIISPEDEKRIKELAKDPKIYDKLIASLAPTMYGLDIVKLAIILQLFGGVPKVLKDGTRIRGDIHLLITGDPATGKCVHKDTYVTLQDGSIKKISDIVEHELSKSQINKMSDGYFTFTNHDVFSMDNNSKIIPSTATILWKRKSPSYLYYVETEIGTRIKTTPSHIFFSLHDGKIIPKKAKDLTTKDYIATVRNIPVNAKNKAINIKIKNRSGSNIIIPTKITPEFCRFIGYIISEDYIQDKGISSKIWFTNNDLDLLNDFEFCVKKTFGSNVTINEKKLHPGKNTINKYISSVEIIDFIKKLDNSLIGSSNKKRIPDIILQTSNENLGHTIKAIFDGKAKISKKQQGMSITIASEELVEQIKLVLLRFGIISKLYLRLEKASNSIEEKRYYRLNVSEESFKKYVKEIGFTSKVKQQKAKKILNDTFHIKIENLNYLNNSDILWEKIAKIRNIKSDFNYVYDLQVIPYHNFIANNVVVHNSQLIKLASQMIPRGKYVSGKGVTGAGLTAAVVKDEQFLGGWVLEAGALVLANNSLISIDEFDKMEKGDQIAMHEAMSLQQISIAKASIVATLPAKTAVLAGANPKLGRFDPYIPIGEQIDIPETLLSRFDVKFALRDIPTPEIDTRTVDHLLQARHFGEEKIKPLIEPEFLRKYIAYAKINSKPILTEEAGKLLKQFYVDLRSKVSEEGAPVPITLRQYESLIRLSESSARVQLRNKVNIEDAQRAIDIMKFSLRQFGFDPETGMIDIDRAEGAITSKQRSKIRIVLDLIEELQKTMKGKTIPSDELVRRAKEEGVSDIEDILKKMKNEGMIFEPRIGFIQKI